MKKARFHISRTTSQFTCAVLALVMLISLLSFAMIITRATSINNVIEEVYDATIAKDHDGLMTNKKADINSQTGKGTLSLEAYVTGKIEEVATKPTDFIFVLDQSGTMAYPGSKDEYVAENKKEFTYDEVNNKGFYYKDEDGNYYQIIGDTNGKPYPNTKYQLYYMFNGQRKYLDGESSNMYEILYRGTLYRKWQRRDDLKAAVSSFTHLIQKNAQEKNVNHKIAMVGFANTADVSSNYKNTGILTTHSNEMISYQNAKDTDYKNALIDVNINNSVNPIIGDFETGAISKIEANGNTDTNAGMTMANNILEQNKSSERNQVIIMFTDGEPGGTGNPTTNDTIANNAIHQANIAKNSYGASVYTVGLYTTKEDTSPSSKIDNFMNYTSSNYPEAKVENGTVVSGQKVSDEYYDVTTDGSKLEKIFEKIAISSVFPNITLNSDAILQDVLTDEFILDGDISDSIKVYTANYQGNKQFGEKQLFEGAMISVDQQKIQVTGFDYAKNSCVDGNGTIETSGKKLIVEIQVKRNQTTYGGNDIPTNTIASAIYDGTTKKAIETFIIPTADLDLKYNIETKDKTIYLSETVNLNELIELPEHYGSEEELNINCIPNGTNNKFVDIHYTIKDTSTNETIKEITVQKGTSLNIKEFKKEINNLNKNTKYNIITEVISTPDIKKEIPRESNIYVFTPVIETKDQTIFYGETVDLSNSINQINWECTDSTIEKPLSDIPTIDYKFKQVDNNEIPTNLELEDNLYVVIDKIMINNKEYDSKDINIKKVNNCELKDHNNDSDFTIHLAKGELKITKTIDQSYSKEKQINSYQTFIYKIERRDEQNGEVKEIFYQTLSFKTDEKTYEAIISELKKGYYTITEETTWSMKYNIKTIKDNYNQINGEERKDLYIGSQLSDNKGYCGLDETHYINKGYKGIQANVTFDSNLNNWNGWYSDVAGSRNTFNK